MKNKDLFSNKTFWVVAAFVAGVLSFFLKKSASLKSRKHSCLKIPVSFIQLYKNRGGVRIILNFVERGNFIKLKLTGFNSAGIVCVEKDLITLNNNCLEHGNDFGVFTQDDTGKLLHDIIAGSDLKNFVLKPVPYDLNDDRYVSYDLSDSSNLASYRLNPCPPGCKNPL